MSKEIKRPARITISRVFGGSHHEDDKEVRVCVIDDASGCEVLELELSVKDFGDALFGLGHIKGIAKWRALNKIGTRGENKRETVGVPRKHGRLTTEELDAALAPFEVDGWRARIGDIENHHRRVSGDGSTDLDFYNVTFFRHVDIETGEPVVD